jgi:hypothetical protein
MLYKSSFLFDIGFIINILFTLVNNDACDKTNSINLKEVNIDDKEHHIYYVKKYEHTLRNTGLNRYNTLKEMHGSLQKLYDILNKNSDKTMLFHIYMKETFTMITKDNLVIIHDICDIIYDNYKLLNFFGYDYITI